MFRLSPLHWIVVLGTFLLLAPSPAQGQTASLRGIVTDASDGASLVGANVIVSTPDGERAGAAATNVDGFYNIRGLEPGRYLVRISYIGYQTKSDTLTLDRERRKYSVSLSPAEQTLEEVEVEAERGATQRLAGQQTVGSADLERIPTPGPGGDLAAYLQTLPGVVSVGDRGGQLYVRGGTPSQNLVLVDGLRVIKPFHISGLYSGFPQELVKSADVHAGGFGAQYMGAISSVIDVSLRKGNLKDYQASASVSPFLTSAHVEGPIREGTDSFLALGRYSVIEQAASPIYSRDVPLSFFDFTARYSLQLETASCNVTGMRTADEGRINPDRNLVLSWSNTALGGRCLFFGENLENAIDLSGGYTRFQNDAGTESAPQRSASLSKFYLDLQTEQQFWGNTLEYGGRWVVTNYSFNLDEKFTALQRADEVSAAFQAFASTKIDVGDYLTLRPSFGTHFTVRRIGTPTYEPRFRVSYRPDGTPQQEISFAFGKYNQLENGISDERDAGTVFTVWRPSGEDSPLSQALHGILGYRQQIGSSLELSVEGYAKDLSNIPVPKWSPVARFDTETTLANGRVYGFDARATIETDALYLFLGYGLSTVTYEAARDDLGAWVGGQVFEFHPAHDRRHQFNFVGSYDISDFTLSANWKVTSGRPYTRVSGFDLVLTLPDQYPTTSPGQASTFYDRPYNARLPFYHRLDLSVERSFDLASDLSLKTKVGAINTYDRNNVFYYDIQSLERVNQTPVLPYLSLKLQIN
jgi:hypothetical protein